MDGITRKTTRTVTVTRADGILDLPVRAGDSAGVMFRPDRVEEVLRENSDGRFSYDVTVTGPYRNKDGSDHARARGMWCTPTWSGNDADPYDVMPAEIYTLLWGLKRLKEWS
jgi:hypothetical protein